MIIEIQLVFFCFIFCILSQHILIIIFILGAECSSVWRGGAAGQRRPRQPVPRLRRAGPGPASPRHRQLCQQAHDVRRPSTAAAC